MLNTFISALVAMFFWGKSTKDIEEKTQLASKMRTFVYGVLALFVLVFYIKTYQVATVFHTIQVKGIKESVNANGELADTIATINLVNKFSSNITENFIFNKVDDPDADELKSVSETSGLFMALNLHSGPNYKSRKNPKLEKTENEIKKTYYGYIPEATFGKYTLNDYYPYNHAYLFCYITSSIPSLIPFFPTMKFEDKKDLDQSGGYHDIIMGDCDSYGEGLVSSTNVNDVDGNKHEVYNNDFLHERYVGTTVFCDTITNMEAYHYKFHFVKNFLQSLNFLTAADISQYTCDIILESDCYIKDMKISYDLPIEINPHDSCMDVSSYSFVLNGDFLNKEIANKGSYRFHVKFPTLANLQLIRSLILTTLLTALISLFFCNLFYVFRKWLIFFKKEHISEISVEKAEKFRKKINYLTIAFLMFFLYVMWQIFKEQPFHIDLETYNWLYFYYGRVTLAILVIICIILYFMFRKAYTIKKKDKK